MEILNNYVTNLKGNVYVIYNLPPEVIAVLFAYVSRSPNSFRSNLLKLIEEKDIYLISCPTLLRSASEKAKKFHEKWVVGYGHSSVAEHAVASIAIEDVSILATKVIEDNRLASFTEKSTRYQIFDKTRYIKPKKILESSLGQIYEKTMDFLFDEYNRVVNELIPLIKQKYPSSGEKNYESISKARACDIARYILPAGTLTNLGMTANARVIEHAIRKMLSNDLEEAQEIGKKIKTEVQKIIPTLVKYADANDYISGTTLPFSFFESVQENSAKLVQYDPDAIDKVAASILYKYSNRDYHSILGDVKLMNLDKKERIISGYFDKMGRHDLPLREFEHANYTFDVTLDYGAFRDIQRHRIVTQTNQLLTTELGYCTPDEIIEFGFREDYNRCMEKARECNRLLSEKFPYEAQYVIPLAFRKRVLMMMNLREAFHIIRLRSSKEGHISYRKIAWEMYEEIKKVHPCFAKLLQVDKGLGPSR